MRKIIFCLLAFCLIFSLFGCNSDKQIQISTDLGDFKVLRSRFLDNYDTIKPADGSKLFTAEMEAPAEFDETQYHSYFMPENSAAACVIINGTEYNCVATALQGPPDGNRIEYVLLFEVPANTDPKTTISLKVPGGNAVIIYTK